MQNIDSYMYTRPRRQFGRQCNFTDRSEYLLFVQPSLRRRLEYVLRNPIDRSTQLAPQYADSEVETINPEYDEHGMNHVEGGWPKEINMRDEEQTLRYRKKIEREDNWGIQVTRALEKTLVVTLQNSAVSIYQKFFSDLPEDLVHGLKRQFEANANLIFHDPVGPARPIAAINWSSRALEDFLVLHTHYAGIKSNDEIILQGLASISEEVDDGEEVPFYNKWRTKCSSNSFFIWNLNEILEPVSVLDAEEVVQKAAFCPKDNTVIAGGFESGNVGYWNAFDGGNPSELSSLENCHREAVSAVCWVHSKLNTEFYTGSSDGSVKFWDTLSFHETTREVLLDPTPGDEQEHSRAEGVSVLEFEYTIPIRFIAGSDHGRVFVGNRKGGTPSEILVANYPLLSGPIRTIERNPFFVKNFLLSGDWCSKIWAEECKGFATTINFKKNNQILCGTWSQTRCSLLATGDEEGEIDFWDLLLDHRSPIFTMKFDSPVTSLKFRSDDRYLAMGMDNGDVYLLEPDDSMRNCSSKEKALVSAIFEREQSRCKLVEDRVEEVKLKHVLAEKAAEEKAAAEAAAAAKALLDPDNLEQVLQTVQEDLELSETLSSFKEQCFALDKKRQERKVINEQTEFELSAELFTELPEETKIESLAVVPPKETKAEKKPKKTKKSKK